MIWEVVSLQKNGNYPSQGDNYQKNSPPVIGVAPKRKREQDRDVSEVVEEQLIANTRLLSSDGERNQYMSDAALGRIEKLAKLTPKLGTLAIYLNGEGPIKNEADITENTLKNVRQLTSVKYSAYGSIVGSLDAITVHSGNEFRVWDETTKKPVRCKFDEKDLDHVKLLLKVRVTVSGVVKSNSAGNPIVISAEELEPAPKRELPTIEEMSGLVEDFTAGKSLKEYMKELSDE
jgi:hypothetical protein